MATPPKQPANTAPREPARPKNLPHGRWLGDFPDLSEAEQRLVECCRNGVLWTPIGWDRNNPARPTEVSAANRIRAELIRFLALGGDELNPVHEEGVVVQGALVTGRLSLHQCKLTHRLALVHCYFAERPNLVKAALPELVLNGSLVPGLNADGMNVSDDVSLYDDFTSIGELRLPAAQIGGDLNCSGGTFNNEGGIALNASRINVAGSVFLHHDFVTIGEVQLLGAQIGGNLECQNSNFRNERGFSFNADGMRVTGSIFLAHNFTAIGEVRLLGAQIGGDLACVRGGFSNEGGVALNADGIQVAGAVFFSDGFNADGEVRLHSANIRLSLDCVGGSIKNENGISLNDDSINVIGYVFIRQPADASESIYKTSFVGAISFGSARIGTIIDDLSAWNSGRHLFDGLRYERIVGPLDASMRISWLKSQRPDQLDRRDWRPQPWEQLIKVLRDMGHSGTAADIAMEKQRMMRAAGQIGTRTPRTDFKWRWRNWLDAWWADLSNAVARGFHRFYGALAGYGHRPSRIAAWMLLVWAACWLSFEAGREYGYFGPSNPVIHSNAALAACGAPGESNADGSPKAYWHSAACPMPAEYTTLFPALYSLDVILPLIDLHQEVDWAPIVMNENGDQLWWGYALRADVVRNPVRLARLADVPRHRLTAG